jgi:glutamyl-tRNA synthetase
MLRFAPSPIGDMDIETLRVALLNFIVATQRDEQFIVRIEDIDKQKNIESKDEEILLILEKFALPYTQRFNQSENLHIHQTLAIRLLDEGRAFICTCSEVICTKECSKSMVDVTKLREDKTPFVIRIQKPTSDIVVEKIIATPDEVDSFVILRADGTPSSDFASACDDMLTNIDSIICSEKQLNSTPKQVYIKNLLGYDRDTQYTHLPTIINIEGVTIKWLFEEGFLPDAIINYLVELGNTTPIEIFTLPDALEWFNIESISKSPTKFDIDRLKFINTQHLKRIGDMELSRLFGFADISIGKLTKVYLEKYSTINELEVKIKAIFSPKDFSGKWGEQMRTISDIIADAPYFGDFDTFERYITKESGLRGEELSKSLYYLLVGEEDGIALCDIYPHIKSYILEVAS